MHDNTPAAPHDCTNLLFELAQRKLEQHSAWASDLDDKAKELVGFAGIILATISVAPRSCDLLIGLAVVLLFAAILLALAAYRPISYDTPPDLKALVDKYLDKNEQAVKQQLVSNLVEAARANHARLDKKASWTERAFWSLSLAALLVALDRVLVLVH